MKETAEEDAPATPADESRPVWHAQSDEKALYFSRFQAYLHLGPSRSLLALYNAERKERGKPSAKSVPSSWDDVAREWLWNERARAFDEHQLKLEREAFEHEREKMWEARKHSVQERLYLLGEKIVAKVNQMAEFPLVDHIIEELYPDGRPKVVTVKAARWGFATMGNLSKSADSVFRLAFDMETARVKSSLERLSDDEIISSTTALLDDCTGQAQERGPEAETP